MGRLNASDNNLSLCIEFEETLKYLVKNSFLNQLTWNELIVLEESGKLSV